MSRGAIQVAPALGGEPVRCIVESALARRCVDMPEV
jgi:hypothetical protein